MASMDSLSLELIELIVLELVKLLFRDSADGVPDEETHHLLAPYAQISRKFQVAVERFLYRVIQVTSSGSKDLDALNARPSRKAALRDLLYVIELPGYDPDLQYAMERRREHRANQVSFRDGLVKIWNELSSWDKPPSLFLDLSASSPSDEESAIESESENRWLLPEHSLSIDTESVELPTVDCVSALAVGKQGRRIHPTTVHEMVLNLPNLRVLDWGMAPVQLRHKALKTEYTAALTKALRAPTLAKLEVLTLSLSEYPPNNHDFDTGLERDPVYPDGDMLSLAIRELALRSLKELNIDHVPISPALFGPMALDTNTSFPHLEHVRIEFPILTYDGRWYYTGDRDSVDPEGLDPEEQTQINNGPSVDEPDSDCESVISLNMDRADFLNGRIPWYAWRKRPDPSMFNPLIRSVVAATLRMPRLKNLLLTTRVRGHSTCDYEEEMERQCAIKVNYATPGCYLETLRYPHMSEQADSRCRWVANLGPGVQWDVPDDLQEMMKEKVGDGGDVVIYRSRS
ncbi:hypothetical protein BDV10DRAFT_160190 [Aspergillus recurvatus]